MFMLKGDKGTGLKTEIDLLSNKREKRTAGHTQALAIVQFGHV